MENLSDISGQCMIDFSVVDNRHLSQMFSLLRLTPADSTRVLSTMNIRPGQFVQVLPPRNATFLRRPISVCFVDTDANELWLLVRDAGAGTHAINMSEKGDTLSIMLPLGNGFELSSSGARPLLIGGGVGIAPLLYLAASFNARGIKPDVLIGAQRADALLLVDELRKYATVHIATDDGSAGEHGLVTQHTILNEDFSSIYCCGPMPMMKAVARVAGDKEIPCQVSLENVMGCGIGACLCCVEKTVDGNLCVCKEGPVFDTHRLLWQ